MQDVANVIADVAKVIYAFSFVVSGIYGVDVVGQKFLLEKVLDLRSSDEKQILRRIELGIFILYDRYGK